MLTRCAKEENARQGVVDAESFHMEVSWKRMWCGRRRERFLSRVRRGISTGEGRDNSRSNELDSYHDRLTFRVEMSSLQQDPHVRRRLMFGC